MSLAKHTYSTLYCALVKLLDVNNLIGNNSKKMVGPGAAIALLIFSSFK